MQNVTLDNNNSTIQEIQKVMEQVFASANSFLSSLADNAKTTLEELCDKVTAETKYPRGQVRQFIMLYIKSEEAGVTVERGRYGGIFKGGRKKKHEARPRCPHCNSLVKKKDPAENSQDPNEFVENEIENSDSL